MKEGGDGDSRERDATLPLHKNAQDGNMPSTFSSWEREKNHDPIDPSALFPPGFPFPPGLLAATANPQAFQAAFVASLAAAARQRYPIPLLNMAAHSPVNLFPSNLENSALLNAAHRNSLLSAWTKLNALSSLPTGISPSKMLNVGNQPVRGTSGEMPGSNLNIDNTATFPSRDSYSAKSPLPNSSSPSSNNGSGSNGSKSDINEKRPMTLKSDPVGATSREKVFVCKVCQRCFGYKHVLQNHERTHTGEKPFECKECHKRFTRDHHLKTHMRLHTGEKPYHCTHCDRQFVQVANLRRHLRVHTGERPYACTLCTSRFSDSNQLKAHTLIHRGEKPFHCIHCLGRFRRRHHLMHHKCPKDGGIRRSKKIGKCTEEVNDFKVEGHADLIHATPINSEKKRERKPREPHRIVRLPTSIPVATITSSGSDIIPNPLEPFDPYRNFPMDIPEQTEPEDLSFRQIPRNSIRHLSGLSHSSGEYSDGSYFEEDEDEVVSESETGADNSSGQKNYIVSKNGELRVKSDQR